MPASDFIECMLYEQIEPFGDRRGDLNAGYICATIANVNRGERVEPFSPFDFMPKWDEKPKPKKQSGQEQLNFMLALQAVQRLKLSGKR